MELCPTKLSMVSLDIQANHLDVPALVLHLSRCQFNFREWQPAKSRIGVTFICILFQPFQFGNSTGYGDGNFSIFFRSLHRPILVRYNGSVFARKMHSTTEFAMSVLSKCVCVCACWCVSSSVCVCVCVCVS